MKKINVCCKKKKVPLWRRGYISAETWKSRYSSDAFSISHSLLGINNYLQKAECNLKSRCRNLWAQTKPWFLVGGKGNINCLFLFLTKKKKIEMAAVHFRSFPFATEMPPL